VTDAVKLGYRFSQIRWALTNNVSVQGRSKFIVVIKGKPTPVGLKFYVLAEAETGYILYAAFAYDEAEFLAESHGRTFGLVFDVMVGAGLNDGISYLDQGFVVSGNLKRNLDVYSTAKHIHLYLKFVTLVV